MRNYTIKAVLHFPDGVNKGNLTVRASDEQEAEREAIKKLMSIWNLPKSKIDIIEVRKG